MFRILLYIFLVYLLYQFIFNFLIPVVRTTRQVKKGFREMNSKMNDFMKQQNAQSSQTSKPEDKKEQVGDYIDFEEIK